jgi:hypothetical protein
VGKRSDATFEEIEQTQAALRESIETAKQLTEKSNELIKRHRDELKRGD